VDTSGVPDILEQIIARRRQRLAAARVQQSMPEAPRQAVLQTPANNRFLAALQERRGNAVIAEIKMGSPSLGSLNDRFEPLQVARGYAKNGAAALSVVVEPDYFDGSYELLAACHEASGLPAIAKDFIVDPLQLRWAKRAGASAVLLIAALYTPQELREYADLARGLGLVPLIELHELADLGKLGDAVWELVGVNNRDLRTFAVELGTSLALLHSLPSEAFKVAESGIDSAADLAMLRGAGYDAYLIGTAMLTSGDPEAKLRELLGRA
jgi:indole-3-glycerol phosphate synthase